MEPKYSSELMNDFDYWNPIHNSLYSAPLSLPDVGQTNDDRFLESYDQAKNMNKDSELLFSEEWKRDNDDNLIGFSPPHNSSPVWLENGDNGQNACQNINHPPVSTTEEGCLQTQLLSPSCAGETNFLNGLEKDCDSLLESNILAASDMDAVFNNNEDHSAAVALANAHGMSMDDSSTANLHHHSLFQEDSQDMWRAVGIMEKRTTTPEQIALNQSPSSKDVELMQNNHLLNGAQETDHQPLPEQLNNTAPPQCYPKSYAQNGHHYFRPHVPLGWMHQRTAAQYPMRNHHVRVRKSRCRKPLLRNFQSNFFRLPIQSKNKSPQLQMVKLFRASSDNSPVIADPPPSIQEQFVSQSQVEKNPPTMIKPPDGPLAEDNPELALMKTVDMPSGKRVEDIYVVPSVWITGKDGNGAVKKSSSQHFDSNSRMSCQIPQQSGNNLNSFSQNGGVSPLSHSHQDLNYHPTSNSETFQNQYNFSSLKSNRFPVTSTLNHLNVNTTSASSLAENTTWQDKGYGNTNSNSTSGLKNLIITTLNAPKTEMIPCLKDLCKSVLKDHHLPSVKEHVNAFSSDKSSSSFSAMDVADLSVKSLADNNEPSDQQALSILTIKESPDHDDIFDNMPLLETEANQRDHVVALDPGKENVHFDNESIELLNSISYPDIPTEDTDNLASIVGNDDEDSKRDLTSFNPDKSNDDVSTPLNLNYPDDLAATLGVFSSDQLSGLDAIINGTPDPVSLVTPMSASNSCESIQSGFDNANEVLSEHANTVSSLPDVSSSSSFIDSPFAGEMDDEESFNPPLLMTLMRQVKELHTNDPMNKPLANLSTTLHLLHDAEKTLCNANFGVYQQLKMGQHSKFGHLVRCILSLTSTVVTMGKSLIEWTKSSVDDQCLKTVDVLANLYQTNIINLIELITPYFHYLCGLIASCHSDILRFNKSKTATGSSSNLSNGHSSYSGGGLVSFPLQVQGLNVSPPNEASAHAQHYAPHNLMPHCDDVPRFDVQEEGNAHLVGNFGHKNISINSMKCSRSEEEFAMVPPTINTPPLAHIDGKSPSTKNHHLQKKQKLSLLKHGQPPISTVVKSASSPYATPADPPRPSASSYFKYATTPKPDSSQVAKSATLLGVKSKRNLNGKRPSSTIHYTHSQPQPVTSSFQSHNRAIYQSKSSIECSGSSGGFNQMPCVVSYRAPLQDGSNKSHPMYVGAKHLRVHPDCSSPASQGGFSSGVKTTSNRRDPISASRKY